MPVICIHFKVTLYPDGLLSGECIFLQNLPLVIGRDSFSFRDRSGNRQEEINHPVERGSKITCLSLFVEIKITVALNVIL